MQKEIEKDKCRPGITCPGVEPFCRFCLPLRRRWTRSYLSEIMIVRVIIGEKNSFPGEYDSVSFSRIDKNQYLFLRRPHRIRSASRPPWLFSPQLSRSRSNSRAISRVKGIIRQYQVRQTQIDQFIFFGDRDTNEIFAKEAPPCTQTFTRSQLTGFHPFLFQV